MGKDRRTFADHVEEVQQTRGQGEGERRDRPWGPDCQWGGADGSDNAELPFRNNSGVRRNRQLPSEIFSTIYILLSEL